MKALEIIAAAVIGTQIDKDVINDIKEAASVLDSLAKLVTAIDKLDKLDS